MIQNIGFMQGRLSPVIDGKIQSFPWETWQSEIKIAKNIGFNMMEWTLDQHNLYENPSNWCGTNSSESELLLEWWFWQRVSPGAL